MTFIALMAGAAVTAIAFIIFVSKRRKNIADKEQIILTLSTQNAKLVSDNEHLEKSILEGKEALSEAEERSLRGLAEQEEKFRSQMKEQDEKSRQSLREQNESAEKQLKTQMDALKLAFAEAAEKMFDEKTKGLSEANNKDIKAILDPLKEKMEEFKKEVQESKEKSLKNAVSIEEQIKSMMEKTTSLGKEADNLASALKGNNKIQGNWGETHLENLLQDGGFIEGVDYYKQETIRDEANQAVRSDDTGRRMVPDYIVTFPDKKVVIIDSKVSLSAYMDYCDKDASAEALEDAKKRHIESVKTHIAELSRKDYAAGIRKTDKNSLKYVIMYIPNDNAFQLFFQDNKQLWNEAFDKNVIITGDFYIITMLAIIRYIWDEHERQRNTEAIANTASELLDRVNSFISTFTGIGKSIDKMKETFDNANNKLFGRGPGSKSVAITSEKLQKLGIQCKTPILGHPSTYDKTSISALPGTTDIEEER